MRIGNWTTLSLLVLSLLGGCRCANGEPGESNQRLFNIVAGDKAGFMDQTGKIVIPPQFDVIGGFSEGLAGVGINSRYFYIDENGTEVVELPGSFRPSPLQHSPRRFSEGLAVFYAENGLQGYFDRSGNVVIPPSFFYAGDFSEGLARIAFETDDGDMLYGFIDKTGRPVIGAIYYYATDFRSGRASVTLEDEWPPIDGLIDKSGNYIVEPAPGYVGEISEGLAVVERNGLRGYVDLDGNWAIKPRFPLAMEFSEGRAAVKVGDLWGFIDKSGAIVVKPRFQDAEPFSEGLAAVSVEGKWGYINRNGRIVIAPQFERVYPFSFGRAVIRLDAPPLRESSWLDGRRNQVLAIIDNQGKVLFQFQGDVLSGRYEDGLLLIQRRGVFAYVDTNASIVWNGTGK